MQFAQKARHVAQTKGGRRGGGRKSGDAVLQRGGAVLQHGCRTAAACAPFPQLGCSNGAAEGWSVAAATMQHRRGTAGAREKHFLVVQEGLLLEKTPFRLVRPRISPLGV